MLSVFRPIAPYIRRRATPLVGSAAMSALASGFALVPFFVAYRLITLAFANDIAALRDESPWLLAAAAAGIVLRSLLTAGAAYAAHAAAFALLADLRRAAAEKLAKLPLGFLDRQQSGRLKSILRDDIDRLEDAFAHAVPDIAAGVAAPLLTAAALFAVDWRMTLALIATAPVLVALYVWTMRAKRSLISAYGQTLARFNAQAVEVARGIKVLKAYGGAPRALDELLATVDELAAINEAAERVSLAPWSAFLVCLRATLLVVVPVGAWLALAGSLDAATFLLFVLLSLVFNQPLLTLAYTATGFVWKVHLAGRNFAWLMETPEIAEPATPRRPAGDDLRFDDVAVRHDDKTIVSNVTFSVPAGSMTALVGASGAGKTSLALLVARFAEPAAGRVTIGGVDVAEMSESDLLARVAMVFQDTFLFDDTIYENIRLGRPEATAEEIRDAARRAQVTEFSDAFPEGLDTPIGPNGGRLSGGQRQRVAIARALLKDAPIILLDEATASLDPETEAEVLVALAELVAGRTTLVIAHRLASVRAADQVAFLHEGALRGCGPHEDLIARDAAYAVFWSAKPAGAPSAIPAAPTRKDVRDPPPPVSIATEPSAPEPLATGSAWRALLSLLGPARGPLMRRAAPLLALETIFSSAPVFIALSVVVAVSSRAFDASGVLRATALLVAAYVISGALTYAAQSILFRSQRLAASALQRRVIRHMMSLPLGFFQGAGGNAVSGLFSTHLGQLDLVTPPTLLIRAGAMPAVAAMFLLWFDWRLGLAALAGVPVFAAVLFWNGRSHVAASRRLLACRERANALTLEYLLGLPVARSFQLIGDRLPRFSQAIRDEAQASLAATRPIAIIAAIGPAALELGFVAILALGGALFVEGSLSAAAFAIFVTLGLVFYRPMFDLIELVAYGRSLAGHVEAIAAVLAVAPLPSRGAATDAPSGSAVRFRDVSFAYGERHGGLHDVDIEAPEGKVTAIVGPSGAGKSTALSLLARFFDVERGAIELGGVDIRDLPLTDLYSRLSIVFQDPFLFRDTARVNIALGRPGAADDDIVRAAVAAQIHETISALPNGYDTVLGENGAPLSGGERQRLALARALLKDSEIVLLDEAVAAVDPDAKEDIRAALTRLCAGKTVLVVSHDLSTAEHADHIVVLEAGRVVTQGRHAELLARGGLYARLWTIQANARSIAIRASETITASAAQ